MICPLSLPIPVGISIEKTNALFLLIALITFLILGLTFLFKPVPKIQSTIIGFVFLLSSLCKSFKLIF